MKVWKVYDNYDDAQRTIVIRKADNGTLHNTQSHTITTGRSENSTEHNKQSHDTIIGQG